MTLGILSTVKDIQDNEGLWEEAVLTVSFLRNRMFSISRNMTSMTPVESFIAKKASPFANLCIRN